MARMGRPKSDNPKSINLNIRLTKSQAERIQFCADKLHTSRTDVLLRGLDLVESKIKKK